MDVDQVTQCQRTLRQMFNHGWRNKIPTSAWPEYHHSLQSGTSA